jgi:hypothetical protein
MGGGKTTYTASGPGAVEEANLYGGILGAQDANLKGMIANSPYLFSKPQLGYLNDLMYNSAITSEAKSRKLEKTFNPGAEAARENVDAYYGDLAKGNDKLMNKVADLAAKRGLMGTFASGLQVKGGQSLGQGAVGSEVSNRMLDYELKKQGALENFANSRNRMVGGLDAASAANIENQRMAGNQAQSAGLIGNVYNAGNDQIRNLSGFAQSGLASRAQTAAGYANVMNSKPKSSGGSMIGGLIGTGVGAMFGGVGAPIGGALGSAIGGSFDK